MISFGFPFLFGVGFWIFRDFEPLEFCIKVAQRLALHCEAPSSFSAKSPRDEKETRTIPFHLGSRVDAQFVVKQFNDLEICALVLWHPDEPRQLIYLSLVRAKCPDLPIYIFHCDYRTDKYGVDREGSTAGSLWDTQSEMADDKELQPGKP
jgi:hypothetical protein